MTYDEMEKEFIGKWILIANCKYSEYRKLLGGIPVAVADTIFEGQRDGFYDKFKDPKYAPRADRDFDYDSVPGILSFFNSLEVVGEND
jgi:hypothetical protein